MITYPTRPAASWRDLLAVVLLVGITWAFWRFAASYHRLSSEHPYLVGFLDFSTLSTFGEAISHRLTTGRWVPDRLVRRAALWGVIGLWISAAFPFEVGGVHTLVAADLWPDLPTAFSISLWANIFSGFAFFMMLAHFWGESVITRGAVAPWSIFADPSFVPWARTVLLSLIFFWLPAHTITFLLPAEWRSLFAAYLGIALGLILTTAKSRAAGDVVVGTDTDRPAGSPPAGRDDMLV